MANRKKTLAVESLESRRMMASVSMPIASIAHRGDEITAEVSSSIHVADVQGMRAAEVRIQFDPQLVTTDISRIRGGEVWNGRVAVIANVDQEAGTIVAFLFSARPVKTGGGTLLDIGFVPVPNLPSGEPIEIDLQRVRINEGQIALDVEPQPGPDATDGRLVTEVAVEVVTENTAAPKCQMAPTMELRLSDDAASRSVFRPPVYGPIQPGAVDEVFAEPTTLLRRFPITRLLLLRRSWF